jgi:hypothetical protein
MMNKLKVELVKETLLVSSQTVSGQNKKKPSTRRKKKMVMNKKKKILTQTKNFISNVKEEPKMVGF